MPISKMINQASSEISLIAQASVIPKAVIKKGLGKQGKHLQRIIISRFHKSRGPRRPWKKMSKATPRIFFHRTGKVHSGKLGRATGEMFSALKAKRALVMKLSPKVARVTFGEKFSRKVVKKITLFQQHFFVYAAHEESGHERSGRWARKGTEHPARPFMNLNEREVREIQAKMIREVEVYQANLMRKRVSTRTAVTMEIFGF